jgi:hypothetical protein
LTLAGCIRTQSHCDKIPLKKLETTWKSGKNDVYPPTDKFTDVYIQS